MASSLPVLTYHAVMAADGHGLPLFERHLDALARSGLRSLRPADLDTARSGFLLTFDDGFADLWTHLLDAMAARSCHAVVFASPARTGEGPPRSRNDVTWSGTSSAAHAAAVAAGGPHPAFLRWSELEALETSGLVTVQSHSYAHRMGWISDQITGFHLPLDQPADRGSDTGDGTHWSLADASGGDTRAGIPLHPRGSALAHALYSDAPRLRDLLADWLDAKGGASYVRARSRETVAEELAGLVRSFARDQGATGSRETRDERMRRTIEDMRSARETLERRLGGVRDELALPWGQYDAVTLECARLAGIRRLYTMDRRPNQAGAVGALVHRFRPRRRGALWLRSRLWLQATTFRARMYGALTRTSPPLP